MGVFYTFSVKKGTQHLSGAKILCLKKTIIKKVISKALSKNFEGALFYFLGENKSVQSLTIEFNYSGKKYAYRVHQHFLMIC